MTTLILVTLAAFVIGFLLGDRRGVKQCNAILDGHLQTFLKGMIDEKQVSCPNLDSDDDRPTVH